MGNFCARNSQQDSDNSDETAVLEAKQNNDSENTAALLIKKLITAVKDENEDIVKSVLDEIYNTSDVFVKSWSSDSHSEKEENKFKIWRDAMYIAIEKNTKHSEEIMKLLLDCDIIWSLQTKMNDILLHRLILDGNDVDDKKLRLIEMLLKSGKINVNARNEEGKTALQWADEENLISLLIRYGADANTKDNEGKTPLMPMWCISVSGLMTILNEARTLMDPDAIDCNGRTALMIAASDARPDVVDLLLNAGASVNLSDHLGFTALHHALYTKFEDYDHFPRNFEELKNRKKIFTILLDTNDERCSFYMKNKEWIAKRIEIAEMLLGNKDRPIDVNALSFDKFSPLDLAEGWIPELPPSLKNALKEKGAILNVFQQTEAQSTGDFHLDVRCSLALQQLLCNVCNNYEKDLPVDLFEKRLLSLIDAFQDQIVSGKDQQGRSALHLVAISFSITWAVFNWGIAKIDAESYPRELATTIVKELIRIGCRVNETDKFGRTPLHYANKILKDLLISYGANESVKDKDGNIAIDEITEQSSTNSFDIIMTVIDRSDEKHFLRLMNNKQMEIEVQCVDSQVRAYDDREIGPKTVPELLWDKGEYACHHPLVEKITEEVTDLMSAIAKEIERLDPRFEIKPEFDGSSNEGTKLKKPDEFDFCFLLTKISQLCEVSRSPELPTGFLRLRRRPAKVDEIQERDFDSFFAKDGTLNTEKLNWQFTAILHNALVNIESQQTLKWNLKLRTRRIVDAVKKESDIKMIKPLNFTSINYISIDIIPCIHVDGWWPDEAISNVSVEIKTVGCNLNFDRPQRLYPWVPYSESCARISFAKAESDTIKQSCDSAREAYMIGKTMIDESRSASNYILKNSLLYCTEALTPTFEKASQLGLSLEKLKSKFDRMDRYLWLKCLMKCHLEFVLQDFCPSYFFPNSSSPVRLHNLKGHSLDWMKDVDNESNFPMLYRMAYALYRCTSNDTSESCFQSPAPDPLWERHDRNQLIASLYEFAYK